MLRSRPLPTPRPARARRPRPSSACSVKATVDRLRVEYTELQRNVSDRAAELADLEGRIAKARATAAAIMGGAALPPVPPPAERIAPAPVTDDEE